MTHGFTQGFSQRICDSYNSLVHILNSIFFKSSDLGSFPSGVRATSITCGVA